MQILSSVERAPLAPLYKNIRTSKTLELRMYD